MSGQGRRLPSSRQIAAKLLRLVGKYGVRAGQAVIHDGVAAVQEGLGQALVNVPPSATRLFNSAVQRVEERVARGIVDVVSTNQFGGSGAALALGAGQASYSGQLAGKRKWSDVGPGAPYPFPESHPLYAVPLAGGQKKGYYYRLPRRPYLQLGYTGPRRTGVGRTHRRRRQWRRGRVGTYPQWTKRAKGWTPY